jgi:tRNA A37 threonylcarbamoyladenosine synthetase subunit TsaC/SUA5/YrdC
MDIQGDAAKVVDTIARGELALVPGDLGYAFVGSSAESLKRSLVVKGRAAHKKHGMLGNWDLHREVQVVEDERARVILETLCLDFGLPVGIVAPFNRDHPVLRNYDEETLASCTYDGTIGMLVNNGPLYEACTRLGHERSIGLLGSSANLSGTGPKFRLEDVQQPLRDAAAIEFDYGLAKFHHYQRSSTMIDIRTMKIIRIGSCYDVIATILTKRFGFTDLPEDPGLEALPSGHLNPEQTRY